MQELEKYVRKLCTRAREASVELRTLSDSRRKAALRELSRRLRSSVPQLLRANASDLAAAAQAGLSPALQDRLLLTDKRIGAIARSVEEIAALPDPVGRVLEERERPNGLHLSRVSVPIGSIFFIFESRPNVTIDGGALCFKSGNAVILRGGKEAAHTNKAFASLFSESLKAAGVTPHAVQLVETADRRLVDLLLSEPGNVDLVIPRGGERLIEAVVATSKVPVIKHYKGVCHVYVDKSADPEMATRIAVNAKAQRPGVCNAAETLLLDRYLKPGVVKSISQALLDAGVELRGDRAFRGLEPRARAAKKEDWDTEYLAPILSVAMVDGVEGAIAHIQKHGSQHTDAVVARSAAVQKAFVSRVDSSSIMVNASTRFADGGEYGLGAEVGISTDKLHARGPMGVESLTTYKWIVRGGGQIRE